MLAEESAESSGTDDSKSRSPPASPTARRCGSRARATPVLRGGPAGNLYVDIARPRPRDCSSATATILILPLHLNIAQADIWAQTVHDPRHRRSRPAAQCAGRQPSTVTSSVCVDKGVPHLRGRGRGDLRVHVVVESSEQAERQTARVVRTAGGGTRRARLPSAETTTASSRVFVEPSTISRSSTLVRAAISCGCGRRPNSPSPPGSWRAFTTRALSTCSKRRPKNPGRGTTTAPNALKSPPIFPTSNSGEIEARACGARRGQSAWRRACISGQNRCPTEIGAAPGTTTSTSSGFQDRNPSSSDRRTSPTKRTPTKW